MVHVANHLEKLHWNLLWGGMGNEFKFHLVECNTVCCPIKMVGWR